MMYFSQHYIKTHNGIHYTDFVQHRSKKEAIEDLNQFAQNIIKSPNNLMAFISNSLNMIIQLPVEIHSHCVYGKKPNVLFDQFIASWDGRSFDVDDMFSTVVRHEYASDCMITTIANASCDMQLTTIYGPSSGVETYLSRGHCEYKNLEFHKFRSKARVLYSRSNLTIQEELHKAVSVLAKKIGMHYGK